MISALCSQRKENSTTQSRSKEQVKSGNLRVVPSLPGREVTARVLNRKDGPDGHSAETIESSLFHCVSEVLLEQDWPGEGENPFVRQKGQRQIRVCVCVWNSCF